MQLLFEENKLVCVDRKYQIYIKILDIFDILENMIFSNPEFNIV